MSWRSRTSESQWIVGKGEGHVPGSGSQPRPSYIIYFFFVFPDNNNYMSQALQNVKP